MGFYSAMKYVRLGPSPQITGQGLAEFARAFAALGVAEERCLSVRVRCGGPIDFSNEDGLHEEIVDPHIPTISSFRSLPAEIDEIGLPSLAALADLVAELGDKTIYRAFVSLGYPPRGLIDRVGRPFAENNWSFTPTDWSFSIGPQYELGLDSEREEDEPPRGWIGLSLSGRGYFWPRSGSDIITELEAESCIPPAKACIEAHWPGEWAWLGEET